MVKVRWTNDIHFLLKIQEYLDIGYSWEEIFFKLKPDLAREIKSPENLRKRFGENSYKIQDDNFLIGTSIDVSFDQALESLRKKIGETKIVKPNKKGRKSKWTKILVGSDFHIPFHNIENITTMVKEHSDADLFVINGDLLDCYSASRFQKEMRVPIHEEIKEARVLMALFSETFPKTIINSGNHDDRARKYFEARIDPDMFYLVKHDILQLVVADFENIVTTKDHYSFSNNMGNIEISYFTIIGDCLIAHFEDSSKVPFKVVKDRVDWINQWEKEFGFSPIRMFLQGHTHQLSKAPLHGNKITAGETGCLCQHQKYALKPGAKYRPSTNGYWVVYQKDGITDVNASNYYVI